jgi:hypothetical protein
LPSSEFDILVNAFVAHRRNPDCLNFAMMNDNFSFFLNYPKLNRERDTSEGNGIIVCKDGNRMQEWVAEEKAQLCNFT